MPILKNSDPGKPTLKMKDGKLMVYNETQKQWELAEKVKDFDIRKSKTGREYYREPGKNDDSCYFDIADGRWTCPDYKKEYNKSGGGGSSGVPPKKTEAPPQKSKQYEEAPPVKKPLEYKPTPPPKAERALTNKPKPIYKKAQDTTTGQYQIGEYVWDNVGKKWTAHYFSEEQQRKNYESVRIDYTGKKTSEGKAELDTPAYRSSKSDSTNSYSMSNSFQGQKGGSSLMNRKK
jgi:hypothetical protein